MKKLINIRNALSLSDIKFAANKAMKGHSKKPEVIRFNKKFDRNCNMLYQDLLSGAWKGRIKYIKLTRINPGNGKTRYIDSPSFITRVYQHLFLYLIEPGYYQKDNLNSLNCKMGCGITSKDKKKSVIKKLKHVFYDRRDLEYYLVIDQRKCYEHISPKVVRKMLKRLTSDKWLIDFGMEVCFVSGKLPIGTPTSPLVHHIAMLSFDYLAKQIAPFSVRYADDNFLAFYTKEEANQAKWRIKNYWWYELGIRAKRHTTIIRPLDNPHDFCGFVFHRNPGKTVRDHNKGYTIVRSNILERAMNCKSNESWASYFGILSQADSFNVMKNTEIAMKLKELTEKVKLEKNTAKEIDVKELKGTVFNIYDYEIRSNNAGEANWIKLTVGIKSSKDQAPQQPFGNNNKPILDSKGNVMYEARELRGNYKNLIQYLQLAENTIGGKKLILPLEDVELENCEGVCFAGSINTIKYINENGCTK